jgi:uncharacterized protein (TIGR00645 family)
MRIVGRVIFLSRWLQLPLYLGLIIAQAVYVWRFLCELASLTVSVFFRNGEVDETYVMLTVLGLVDIVMIANLLLMVVVGGYELFVSRLRLDSHPDRPDWLSHMNANILKLKLALAIVGITSVHLLQIFIQNTGESRKIMWHVVIHLTFVASAVALAFINWLDQQAPQHPDDDAAPLPAPHQPGAEADPPPRVPRQPGAPSHRHRQPH